MNKLEKSKTVDITPCWRGIVGVHFLVLESGTQEGKKIAREELFNCAKAADRWNDHAAGMLKTLEDIIEITKGKDSEETMKRMIRALAKGEIKHVTDGLK